MLVLLGSACKKRQEEAPPRATPPVADPSAPMTFDAPRAEAACRPGERTCAGADVALCAADGTPGQVIERCAARCRDGACADTCAVNDVELIYVVDNGSNLYSFDPRKLPEDPFHPVGSLSCNDRESLNSMAVDRAGVAWLDFHSGLVYRASIVDAHCATPGVRPRGAPTSYGMGFVSDGPRATTEKLFVADQKVLAVIDTQATPPVWKPVGKLALTGDNPELTGTGDGRLFAYFPRPGRGFIQELDRETAAPKGPRWKLEGGEGRITAYAFAHWGGVFYVFTTDTGVSSVDAVHLKDGRQERVRTKLPMSIVGAGVSTCAPLLERAP